jgi:hypothetical protein
MEVETDGGHVIQVMQALEYPYSMEAHSETHQVVQVNQPTQALEYPYSMEAHSETHQVVQVNQPTQALEYPYSMEIRTESHQVILTTHAFHSGYFTLIQSMQSIGVHCQCDHLVQAFACCFQLHEAHYPMQPFT